MAEWISPEGIKNILEAAAILAGGIWAIIRFRVFRESVTKLAIGLTARSVPRADDGLLTVFLDVKFTNASPVRLRAKRLRYEGEGSDPAYQDEFETLKYSGSLLLREVPAGAARGPVPWFSRAENNSPRKGDIEIDLFDEYELDGQTDFWMEPGEIYHSGVTLILPRGTYQVMVTFVSQDRDTDFWRRTFLVNVPCEDPKEPAAAAAAAAAEPPEAEEPS
jgi:hypothetical protein